MSARACKLCSTPVPRPGQTYCCPGCERVDEILSAAGYRGDPRKSTAFEQALRAGLLPDPDRQALDAGLPAADAAERPRYGERLTESSAGRDADASGPPLQSTAPYGDEVPAGNNGGVGSADLRCEIDGMWCPSCAWLVEHVLGATPGVLSSTVAFVSDQAEIRYDPERIGRAEIVRRVEELGYRVRTPGEDPGLRGLLVRFGISALLSANVMAISYAYYAYRHSPATETVAEWLPWLLALLTAPVLFGAGAPILRRAAAAARARAVTMDSLISLAALSAYAFSVVAAARGRHDLYFDVCAALITFWLLGRLIEQAAFRKAAAMTAAVRRLLPRKARLDGEGGPRWVEVTKLGLGDRVLVAAGERVPVDGRMLSEQATLATAVLDGEPKPRLLTRGATVPAGSVNGELTVELEVIAPAAESMLARIADQVAEQAARAGSADAVTDALARLLLPVVMLLSALTGAACLSAGLAPSVAFERALAVLVVSCPCALAVAAPLARVVTAGALARAGVIVRGQGALDAVAAARCVAFDKTGTLTSGRMTLERVHSSGFPRARALEVLAALESRAGHPIAFAVGAALETPQDRLPEVGDLRVIPGRGVSGNVSGVATLAGRADWVEQTGGPAPVQLREALRAAQAQGRTAILLFAGEGNFAVFELSDPIRSEAAAAVGSLAGLGMTTALLSGDAQAPAAAVAAAVGIARAAGDLTPEAKAQWLARIEQDSGTRALFVGDGINDAPALAASTGVAVAGGTDFARETAAVLLLDSDLGLLARLVAATRRMRRIVRQNLAWAAAYNAIAIPLAATGGLDPVVAAAAMVTSSLVVTLNSLRLRSAAKPGR